MNNTGSKPHSSTFWTDFSLLAVAVIWGINAPVMKFGILHVDPFVFNAIRLSISAISLWFCVLLFEGPKAEPSEKVKPWQLLGWIVGFSIFSGAVYQITFLAGIFRTTAGNTALIMSSCPMWTAILAVIATRDQLSRITWLGLSMTLLGTILVITQRGELAISGASFYGNLIVLAAALAWASASVASKPMLNHVSAIRLAFYSMFLTLPIHWALAIPNWQDFPKAFEPWTFASIFYSGFFSTGVAYAMWNDGIKKVGAPHAAVYQNVIPLVALIGAWFMIDEVPVALQLWGGASIIAGLVVMRRGRQS